MKRRYSLHLGVVVIVLAWIAYPWASEWSLLDAAVPPDYIREQQRAEALLRRTEALIRPTHQPNAVKPTKLPPKPPVQPPLSTPAVPELFISNAPADKLALIIGINEYQAVPHLQGCVNDARKMEWLLTTRFQFPPENVLVLLNGQATHRNIIDAFQRHLIQRANKDAVVVFHCSSHGSQMRDSKVNPDETDGWDETIVPTDSRTNGVYDISDDELNGLFKQLSAKTKNVTFVFDCCHSGTQVKAPELARRIPRDEREPPPAPTYAVAEKGLSRDVDHRFEGRDYVLLAGCDADEVSFEFHDPITGTPFGALTHFLVQELTSISRAKVAYRDVMRRVQTKVTTEFPTQHPQLEGANQDLDVFGVTGIVAEPFLLVSPKGAEVELMAGAVHGVTPGSVFDVFPPETTHFVAAAAINQLQVIDVGVVTSSVKLLKPLAVPPKSRAVLRSFSHPQHKIDVQISGDDSIEALKKVRARLQAAQRLDTDSPDSPVIRDIFNVVDDRHRARMSVEEVPSSLPEVARMQFAERRRADLDPTRRYIAVTARDGKVLSRPVAMDDPEATDTIVRQITEWGRWFSVLDIENPNPSGLDVTFTVRPGNAPPANASFNGGPPVVAVGERLEFVVTNDGDRPIYFTILDISSSGSISPIYPDDQPSEKLLPGKTWSEGAETTLEANQRVSREYVKLFVTTRPADFTFIRQEGIRGMPRDAASVNNPLVQLLGRANLLSRDRSAVATSVDEWLTITRIVDVIGK